MPSRTPGGRYEILLLSMSSTLRFVRFLTAGGRRVSQELTMWSSSNEDCISGPKEPSLKKSK